MSFLGSGHYFGPEEQQASAHAVGAATANGMAPGNAGPGAAGMFHTTMLLHERMARQMAEQQAAEGAAQMAAMAAMQPPKDEKPVTPKSMGSVGQPGIGPDGKYGMQGATPQLRVPYAYSRYVDRMIRDQVSQQAMIQHALRRATMPGAGPAENGYASSAPNISRPIDPMMDGFSGGMPNP